MATRMVRGSIAVALGAAALIGAWLVVIAPADAACLDNDLTPAVTSAPEASSLRVTGHHWGPCDDNLAYGEDPSPPFESIDVVIQRGGESYVLGRVPVHQRRVDAVISVPFGVVGEWELFGRHEDPLTTSPPVSLEVTDGVRSFTRAAGNNRIETAVAVSQRNFPDGAPTVYLARHDVPFDAMVAATATDGPILLVPHCTLPDVVLDEIGRLAPAEVVGLGGDAAVCPQVLHAASGIDPIPSSADGLSLSTVPVDGAVEVWLTNHREGPIQYGYGYNLEKLGPSGFEDYPDHSVFPQPLIGLSSGEAGRIATLDGTVGDEDGQRRPAEPGHYRVVFEVEGVTLAITLDLPPE